MQTLWPELNYQEWKDTYATLHRWVQIMGKLRMCKAPWLNHSWSTSLYLTSRGFTTSAIPMGDRSLTVEMDLLDHEMRFTDSTGLGHHWSMLGLSVSLFYERFLESLNVFDVTTSFDPRPNELSDNLPFAQDRIHCTYQPEQAQRAFQVFVRVDNVFQHYRAQYLGKSSPSHFFWGSFDLAVTRFSGKTAPPHPGGVLHIPDEVVAEAYSHEVISVGFWPGNEMYPEAAFYSYVYPEPESFRTTSIAGALYHPLLREFLLPYEQVRRSPNPAQTIMRFLETSYQEAAEQSFWERDELEGGEHLRQMQLRSMMKFGEQLII